MTTPPPERPKTIDDLIAIMAALRTPETGCPWDLEQSFRTIAPYTIEEAHEVADAIARGSMDDLKDELGDLLLQVVYHARMAEEEGRFAFADVVEGICAKMVRRHPHVFGDEQVRSSVELKGLWERIKAEEKAAAGGDADQDADEALQRLDRLPATLPALARAAKLQAEAAKTGFDWPGPDPVLGKIREELAELEQEAAAPDPDRVKREEEFGDLLFVLANLARHWGFDPEAALRGTNVKFVRRFARMRALLREEGHDPDACSLETMDACWDRAKAEERQT